MYPDPNMSPDSDVVVLQASSSGIVSAGRGDDVYIISNYTAMNEQQVTIADGQGSNMVQLMGNLSIESSVVAENAVKLKLSSGAEVTIMNAESMTFVVGGSVLEGEPGHSYNFAQFSELYLGVQVPAKGQAPVEGRGFIVGDSPRTPENTVPLQLGIVKDIILTDRVEHVYFDVVAARDIEANSQITLHGFDLKLDSLLLEMPQEFMNPYGSVITNLYQAGRDYFHEMQIDLDPTNDSALVTFGADANGDVISLELTGVASRDDLLNVTVELM